QTCPGAAGRSHSAAEEGAGPRAHHYHGGGDSAHSADCYSGGFLGCWLVGVLSAPVIIPAPENAAISALLVRVPRNQIIIARIPRPRLVPTRIRSAPVARMEPSVYSRVR